MISPAPTPAALRIGYWFALMLSVALAAAFLLTAGGILPYTIAGHFVSRAAWWRVSPVLVAVSALAAAIAFGIRQRRTWTRVAVMLLWSAIAVATLSSALAGDIPRDVLLRGLAEPVLLTVLSGWYFYVKPNVVEYFRAIGDETDSY